MFSGLKKWHLLSIGNPFHCGLGGEGVISFDDILGRGDQTYVTKCGKRRVGSMLGRNRVTSFMDDPMGRSLATGRSGIQEALSSI